MTGVRYVAIVLGLTAVLMAAAIVANRTVDPFAIRADGPSGEQRVVPGGAEFWHKTRAVAAQAPAVVLLGNSRAAAGLDPGHPALAEPPERAFNLALGAASIEQIRDLLRHAQAIRPLRRAIIGLDLEQFVDGGRPNFDRSFLAGNEASVPDFLNSWRLHASGTALAATLERAMAGTEPVTSDAHPGATGPNRAVLEAYDGQRGLIWITEFVNFHARRGQLAARWRPTERWDSDPRRAASMLALRDIAQLARAARIDLRLFISPVHARHLEWYRLAGWWPLYDAWKRALVDTLAAEADGTPGRLPFPLHDFSGHDRYTTEPLPRLGDLNGRMRWYTDSSHYSRELGNLVLDRIMAVRPTAAGGPAGPALVKANIGAHLDRLWRDADDYRRTHATDVAEVADILRTVRRVSRR